MARRKTSLFNLSFLDLLTSALGAIIFLFVITPKGGQSAAKVQQAGLYIDTSSMKIYGSLDDSLMYKRVGDTLFAVLVDYKDFPQAEKEKKPLLASLLPERKPDPKPEKPKLVVKDPTPEKPKPADPVTKKPEIKVPDSPEPVVVEKPVPKPPKYTGDAPSVPAMVSFEVKWPDKSDNIDLRICKDGSCVYGGRKKDGGIGNWDSGKSRNRWFGNDLRTNQEAVRQFDRIIPGDYEIFVKFKESDKGSNSVRLTGMIYTKNENGEERGETFSITLDLSDEDTFVGIVSIQEDGQYQFKKR